jgi:hypothetical protein
MERMVPSPPRALARVGSLRGYQLARGDTDPRGWPVMGADHLAVGSVVDLVADVVTMQVRYLEVGIAAEFAGSMPGYRILVPVERAAIDRSARMVQIPGLDAADAARVQPFTGLPLGYDPDLPFRHLAAAAQEAGERIRLDRRRRAIGAWAFGALVLAVLLALGARALREAALAEPREPWPGVGPASAAPVVEPAPPAEPAP